MEDQIFTGSAEGQIRMLRHARYFETGLVAGAYEDFNRAVKQAFSMPPGSLFGEGAYVPPARFNSMREAFPTFDWFVRISETASLRRLRD